MFNILHKIIDFIFYIFPSRFAQEKKVQVAIRSTR